MTQCCARNCGGPLGVTGGKTPGEYMYSALPQVDDIARSAFHYSVDVLRITRPGSEQFHARLWLKKPQDYPEWSGFGRRRERECG
jgi:hypothetical protein